MLVLILFLAACSSAAGGNNPDPDPVDPDASMTEDASDSADAGADVAEEYSEPDTGPDASLTPDTGVDGASDAPLDSEPDPGCPCAPGDDTACDPPDYRWCGPTRCGTAIADTGQRTCTGGRWGACEATGPTVVLYEPEGRPPCPDGPDRNRCLPWHHGHFACGGTSVLEGLHCETDAGCLPGQQCGVAGEPGIPGICAFRCDPQLPEEYPVTWPRPDDGSEVCR